MKAHLCVIWTEMRDTSFRIYCSSVHTKSLRVRSGHIDNSECQFPITGTRLEKCCFRCLGEGTYNMSLQHLITPESKEPTEH